MNKTLFKYSFLSFLVEPVFYAASIITLLYTGFMFFLANHFFVVSSASSDLRPFFSAVAQISILTVPLLVFALRRFLSDDSLPVSAFTRFLTLNTAVFCAAFIPVVLLVSVPVFVNFYGAVDFGQTVTGFLGLLFYLFTSIAFVIFIFSLVKSQNGALPFFVSVVVLFIFNFSHLVPLYLRLGETSSYVLQKISFAWHFDASSKGIIDSRDIVFYIAVTFIFLVLSCLFEYRRTGRPVSKLTSALLILTVAFSSIALSRLYFRVDFSKYHQFSVSRTSRTLCSNLENPLRITYFQSKELKQYYPQCGDVVEFLKEFAASSDKITLSLEKADGEKLSRLGIQGQQIKSENTTKLEYTMVYSAILMQYLDSSTIIPFVLSTQTLEYDLTQRIQSLLTNNERRVYVLSGNGRELSNDYAYLLPWLTTRGFVAQELPSEKVSLLLENLTPQALKESQLVVLGSSKLTNQQCQSIKYAVENGMSSVFMTSPYSAALEEDWNVTKNKNDYLLPVLNGWGFAFDNSLAEDISNFPLTMETGEGNETQYQTVNYPLWLSILPQNEAYEGVTVFWPSPVLCYGKTQPLLVTSPMAWKQNPGSDEKAPFIINPFLIPKTASAGDSPNGQFTVAAIRQDEVKAAVISDQFFVSSLMTGFISGDQQGDFRNYDYLTSILLELKGEEKIAALMENSKVSKALYKINDESSLIKMRKIVLVTQVAILPSLILIFALVVFLLRRRGLNEKKSA